MKQLKVHICACKREELLPVLVNSNTVCQGVWTQVYLAIIANSEETLRQG
jgi:hypothetical protein